MYYFWHNWGGTNNNGNLLQVDERTGSGIAWASMTDFNQSFTYDNANRLLTASEVTGGSTSWSRSFGYDAFGNSWVSALSGIGYGPATPAWNVYNGKNQIGSSPYDNAGNMTALPPSYTFTYDAENRQTSETNSQTPNATYSYDGDGRRVSKTVTGNGGPTIFVYDASGEMAAEYSSGAAATPQCATCYLSYDHLGSVRMVTDGGATVIARHDYLPFGDEIPGGSLGRSSQWGPFIDKVNQKFTGKERDAETWLDYFGARYYGSSLGRFTSPDEPLADQHPEDPQSWNLYAYGRNNPLNGIDPAGQNWLTDFGQAFVNCFRYSSCHTTTVVAQQRESAFMNSLIGGDGKPLNPSQKEDLQNQLFGRSTPGDTIKAVDYYNRNLQHVQQDNSEVPPPLGSPAGSPRAQYENPGQHDTSSPNFVRGKSPLPNDAESVYESAIKDPNRAPGTGEVYYGKNADGQYYRYSGQNGRVHWSGTVPREQIPNVIRKALQQ